MDIVMEAGDPAGREGRAREVRAGLCSDSGMGFSALCTFVCGARCLCHLLADFHRSSKAWVPEHRVHSKDFMGKGWDGEIREGCSVT